MPVPVPRRIESSPRLAEPPPRLALILGSGGVRSIAALGVAEVLNEEGIRPDLIVGCSSGALFGALLASGVTPREGLRSALHLWSGDLTRQHRWRAYAEMLFPRLMGFGAGFGLRDDRLIAARLRDGFGSLDFDELATPLRIVATEAATGESRILTHGSVVDAIRASMAVPFVFPSVEREGLRLVDGVISDPLPVGAAADAGCALALGFFGMMPRRVDRPSRLIAQASTALINNLMQARIDAARASGQDVQLIQLCPDRRVGLWQVDALPYLFEAGRRAALRQLPQIAALAERARERGCPSPGRADTRTSLPAGRPEARSAA